jgi:hypothetical protein
MMLDATKTVGIYGLSDNMWSGPPQLVDSLVEDMSGWRDEIFGIEKEDIVRVPPPFIILE